MGTDAEMEEMRLQAQGPEDAGWGLGPGGRDGRGVAASPGPQGCWLGAGSRRQARRYPKGLRGSLALTTPRGWTSSLQHSDGTFVFEATQCTTLSFGSTKKRMQSRAEKREEGRGGTKETTGHV